jgi:hypothetical protein
VGAPSNHRQAERVLIQMVHSGRWEIDCEGRIWRVRDSRGLQVPNMRVEKWLSTGYLMVRWMVGGHRVVGLAHRLVWQALRGDAADGLVINHLNGIKSDNRPVNLEIATYSRNATHAHRVLGVNPQHGQHNPGAKLTPSDVAEIRAARARGEDAVDIARRFGVAYQTIYRICSGERWGHLAHPKEVA